MPPIGKVVLDTSAATALLRGKESIIERLLQVETIYVPVVVLGELLYGVRQSGRPEENYAQLQRWLRSVVTIPLAPEIADEYAIIKSALKLAGTPIPENDIWIAAHARRLGLALFVWMSISIVSQG